MDILHQTLGLVSEQDTIRLADGLVVEVGYVVDRINWARHRLRGPAEPALRLLQAPCNAGLWLRQVRGMGISSREACGLLLSLNEIGGLRVRYGGWLGYAWRINLRIHGVVVANRAHRYPATVMGLLRSLGRVGRWLLAAVVLLCAMAYGANIFTWSFAMAQVLFVVVLVLSTIVHEGWHIVQARRFGASACIVVRGVRIGVLHGRLLDREELASAVLGPISGSTLAFLFAIPAIMLDAGLLAIVSVVAVGLFHWASWLPVYGDGQTIRKYWRRYASSTA